MGGIRSLFTPAHALIGAVLLIPITTFAVVRAFPSLDATIMEQEAHFWIVGVTSLTAAVAFAVVVVAAPTLRETRLLFLALAFMSIAGIFSMHGLLTPGVIVHEYHYALVASSWISVVVGATFVALSVAEFPPSIERLLRRAGFVIAAWGAIAIGAYVVVSFAVPAWLDNAPTDARHVQYSLALCAQVLLLVATWRYLQAYMFARLPGQAAMVAALVLLLQVPPSLLWGEPWYISWWTYHVAYLGAFVALLAGWGIEAKRAGSLRAIADALAMRDALTALNRGRDAHVLQLVDAIEAKDVATLGHVSRVGSYAHAIGKRLGLAPQQLRDLVLAAQMHDVGKIGVPDAVLRKPAALTDDEFAVIKLHTHRGDEIARQVDALRTLAPVIRAHHERLDGSGYPDGLSNGQIPLLSRIIAVADTYDAMTSHRPYRDALSHDEAIAELRRVRAVQLDAACVDAFIAWCDEERATAAA